MEPHLSKGRYKFTYLQNGFIQYKDLITQVDYSRYKENQLRIYELELSANKKNSNNRPEISAIKRENKSLFGEQFFVEDTPLFKAIETGYIDLLPQQGGRHFIKIERICLK